MKYPYHIQHTPIRLNELTPDDRGGRILYQNKENKEYGIYSHSDSDGAYLFFAGNVDPLYFGFDTNNHFFKAEVI